MKNISLYLLIALIIMLFVGAKITENKIDPAYQKGFDCWIIIAKLNILTDNWTGEYLRLSNKYFKLDCQWSWKKNINTYEYIEAM